MEATSDKKPRTPPVPEDFGPGEVREIHTRILRLALGIEDSRAYWENVDPAVPLVERASIAFNQRWFGGKSLERVRYLLACFASRYDAYPAALRALGHWRSMEVPTRQVVCHWHLQLSDPIYRRFTGDFLVHRRVGHNPTVDRDAVLRWLRAEFPDKWAEATCVQFASKLLSAALEAGLVSKRDPRSLIVPKVGDLALAYLFYLLRETKVQGSLTENPYLLSVGLDEEWLFTRARALPGVSLRRMMGVIDFEWGHADLDAWAQAVLS